MNHLNAFRNESAVSKLEISRSIALEAIHEYESIVLDIFVFFLPDERTKIVSCTVCEEWGTFQSIFH